LSLTFDADSSLVSVIQIENASKSDLDDGLLMLLALQLLQLSLGLNLLLLLFLLSLGLFPLPALSDLLFLLMLGPLLEMNQACKQLQQPGVNVIKHFLSFTDSG
jgi:hypothetical protein